MKTKSDSGRKGGLATLGRYGRDQLAEWGKRGGRPRDMSCDEKLQQRRIKRQHIAMTDNKEVRKGPPNSLRLLNAHYKLRQRSTDGEIEPAELAQETPQEPALPGRKRGESPHV